MATVQINHNYVSITMNNLSSIQDVPFQASCAPRHYMLGYDLKCHAWCPELNRIVTASEIWHLLFGEDIINTELSFQCVDIGCRARLILRNCQPYMSDIEAQFRLYPRARHHHHCAYIAEQQKKKNKLITQRRLEAIKGRPRLQGWCA